MTKHLVLQLLAYNTTKTTGFTTFGTQCREIAFHNFWHTVQCSSIFPAFGRHNKEQVIVFTNGCFDIIHSGHLDLLKEARSYGDKLIVGLNSDKSISKLKGPERPIIGQSERKKILLALKYVDEVIIFNEENPLKLIKKLKPSILVKGADYTKEQVIGGEFVESYGGQIKLVKLAKGKSTSNIINKISF